MTDTAVEVPDSGSPRTVDLDSLKALAHPLRVQILHVLTRQGAQTASSLAAELGESSGSTSYHLRQLEAKGFIEEDASRGTGRERWWRRVPGDLQVWSAELAEVAEGRSASSTVLQSWTEHDRTLLARYIELGESRYESSVLEAAAVQSRSATLSASELAELSRRVEDVIRDVLERAGRVTTGVVPVVDPHDPVHRIQIQFNAFPID